MKEEFSFEWTEYSAMQWSDETVEVLGHSLESQEQPVLVEDGEFSKLYKIGSGLNTTFFIA